MSLDYSLGDPRVNRDASGVPYGIYSGSDLSEWFEDDTSTEYDPACPECGHDLSEGFDPDSAPGVKGPNGEPSGRISLPCGHSCRRDDIYPHEPTRVAFNVSGDRGSAEGFVDSSGDVWVTSSDYVAHGSHASPCAPGAVTYPGSGGIRALALPPSSLSREFRRANPSHRPKLRRDRPGVERI